MNQFDFNHWSFVLQFISLVVSIAVGVVVYVYTRETQKLRELAARQIERMTEQIKMSSLQVERMGEQAELTREQVKLSGEQLRVSEEQVSILLADSRRARIPFITCMVNSKTSVESGPEPPANSRVRYELAFWNVTDRIAHSIGAHIRIRADYFWVEHMIDFLPQVVDKVGILRSARGPRTWQEIRNSLIVEYGEDVRPFLGPLTGDDHDYLAVIFRDMDGMLMCVCRDYWIDDFGIPTHGPIRQVRAANQPET